MCIKKVERFQADDGSLHETERAAIIANLVSLLGSDEIVVRIVAKLSRVQALLRQLSEPRNQRPAHEEPRPVSRGTEEEERRYEEAQGTTMVVDRNQIDTATETITIDDLRPGQMLELDITDYGAASQPEYRSFMHAILDHIDYQEIAMGNDGIAVRQIVNGVPLTHWNALFKVSEITRILKPPEELLTLEEAKADLEAIDKEGGSTTLTPLDHKRRILLHRRIAEIEATEGATTHAASID
jgi:hypothetical protein